VTYGELDFSVACGILELVTFLNKFFKAFSPTDAYPTHAAEVVVWPAASNGRRLVAVCSACQKTLRSGFTAEAVSGPYPHDCTPNARRHR